jgi:hypothetical protein
MNPAREAEAAVWVRRNAFEQVYQGFRGYQGCVEINNDDTDEDAVTKKYLLVQSIAN